MLDLVGSFLHRHHIYGAEVETFADGYALLRDTGPKDIVFLDMEMPGMNGIHVGKVLKESYPDIILIVVSSFVAYVGEALRLGAFGFLHKPIEVTWFERSMEEAVNALVTRSVKLLVSSGGDHYVLDSSEIVMLESKERKTIIHTTEEDYCSAKSLNYWTERLPRDIFIATHKSFLVNLHFVEGFNRSTVYLSARKLQAFLTKRKYSAFRNRLKVFHKIIS
jgi:two-component system LytT family response regulator